MDIITKDEKIKEFPKIDDPSHSIKNEKSKPKTNDDKLNDAPNVVGQSLQEAKATLSEYDLAVYYKFSDSVANGYIISQGTQDGRISLEVSKGPRPNN